MFFAIKHSFQMSATKVVAFVQILNRIYSPMKRRSFFQNLVSCNICQQYLVEDPKFFLSR